MEDMSTSKMRQTDINKWQDPWFRKLSVYHKAGYMFLLDNCDNSGVWEVDKDYAEFHIGHAVDWEHLIELSEGRLRFIDGNRKLWITKFMTFHSENGWKPNDRYVRHVRNLVRKHNLREYGFDEEAMIARGIEGASKDANTNTVNSSAINKGLGDDATEALVAAVTKWLSTKRYKAAGLKQFFGTVRNRVADYGAPAVVAAIEDALSNGYKGWDFHDKWQKFAPKQETKSDLPF